MKFEMLCNIILEGSKSEQMIKVAVANNAPTFTTDDILRDPSDPSKGVKSYLDDTMKGIDQEGQLDPDTKARRVLRRLNWVTHKIIKRSGIRSLNVRKLFSNIMATVEQYLRDVVRTSDEEINGMKFNIAKEAVFIGNLLLEPTDKYPSAKGVFAAVDDDAIAGTKKGKKKKGSADMASAQFRKNAEDIINAFDSDLFGIIKEIIRNGITKDAVEPDNSIESEEAPAEEITKESIDSIDGVTVEDILKDSRIKGVFEPNVVRKVIKSMLDVGSVIQTAEGTLSLPETGNEAWRQKYDKYRDEKASETLEDIPNEEEISTLGTEEETPEPAEVEAEDEEEAGDFGEEESKKRLGYKKGKRTEEETEDDSGEEEEETW